MFYITLSQIRINSHGKDRFSLTFSYSHHKKLRIALFDKIIFIYSHIDVCFSTFY